MAEARLYNSKICRLCAQNNDNGEFLFTNDSEDLSALINRYLPLKISDDGILPCTICPGCNIQLQATIQFFELIKNGQCKIRKIWKQQTEIERQIDQKKFIHKNPNLTQNNPEKFFSKEDNQTIYSKDHQNFNNVMSNNSMYSTEHDLTLQMEGLDKPKRRRGRPPKNVEDIKGNDKTEGQDQFQDNSQDDDKLDEEEFDGDGRKKRRRKVPKRYMETVQGKELEKMFKEEGVYDEDVRIKYEVNENQDISNLDNNSNSDTEVIGHLETLEGKNLEVVVINKNRTKSKIKRKSKFICSFCGKGFMQRSKYIVHKSFHKTIKYECIECGKQFSTRENLLLHQKAKVHTGEKKVEINDKENILRDSNDETETLDFLDTNESTKAETLCTALQDLQDDTEFMIGEENNDEKNEIIDPNFNSFSLTDELQNSDSKESGITFQCDKCNKHFQSKSSLYFHIKIVHLGEKPFVCEICNKAFAYQSSLNGHQEIVHQNNKTDEGYPCDICGKLFTHANSIMYHKITEHNKGRRFVCNKCGKNFKHKQLLQRHQLVHSEDRPYPCESCNASFKTKANLLNHQSTHTGEKKHSCPLCEQKFAHKTSLTLHQRTHSGIKPYKCDVCAKSFSQNGNLQEHMRIHTGEKPYGCDECGRKFTTSSQYKLHVKRHTGEKPWKCEWPGCSKRFLHKDTWKCHVRRHNNERPFRCPDCPRDFTEQWALKKHLRLHTGEKPYTCEICSKSFADCSNLTKHKKTHRFPSATESEELSGRSSIGSIWQILPTPQDENTELSNNLTQVITDEAGVTGNGLSQIIYVYQDPNNSNDSTIHFDEENINNSQEPSLGTSENDVNPETMELSVEPDLQFQITDEEGNAIPLSIQEAKQLLAEGQLISQLNDASTIQGLPSSLEIPSNIETVTESDIGSKISSKENSSRISCISTIHRDDTINVMKDLKDKGSDNSTNQVSDSQLDLNDAQPTIELITQDGRKVRLLTTSLNIDPTQLASGYLTIA